MILNYTKMRSNSKSILAIFSILLIIGLTYQVESLTADELLAEKTFTLKLTKGAYQKVKVSGIGQFLGKGVNLILFQKKALSLNVFASFGKQDGASPVKDETLQKALNNSNHIINFEVDNAIKKYVYDDLYFFISLGESNDSDNVDHTFTLKASQHTFVYSTKSHLNLNMNLLPGVCEYIYTEKPVEQKAYAYINHFYGTDPIIVEAVVAPSEGAIGSHDSIESAFLSKENDFKNFLIHEYGYAEDKTSALVFKFCNPSSQYETHTEVTLQIQGFKTEMNIGDSQMFMLEGSTTETEIKVNSKGKAKIVVKHVGGDRFEYFFNGAKNRKMRNMKTVIETAEGDIDTLKFQVRSGDSMFFVSVELPRNDLVDLSTLNIQLVDKDGKKIEKSDIKGYRVSEQRTAVLIPLKLKNENTNYDYSKAEIKSNGWNVRNFSTIRFVGTEERDSITFPNTDRDVNGNTSQQYEEIIEEFILQRITDVHAYAENVFMFDHDAGVQAPLIISFDKYHCISAIIGEKGRNTILTADQDIHCIYMPNLTDDEADLIKSKYDSYSVSLAFEKDISINSKGLLLREQIIKNTAVIYQNVEEVLGTNQLLRPRRYDFGRAIEKNENFVANFFLFNKSQIEGKKKNNPLEVNNGDYRKGEMDVNWPKLYNDIPVTYLYHKDGKLNRLNFAYLLKDEKLTTTEQNTYHYTGINPKTFVGFFYVLGENQVTGEITYYKSNIQNLTVKEPFVIRKVNKGLNTFDFTNEGIKFDFELLAVPRNLISTESIIVLYERSKVGRVAWGETVKAFEDISDEDFNLKNHESSSDNEIIKITGNSNKQSWLLIFVEPINKNAIGTPFTINFYEEAKDFSLTDIKQVVIRKDYPSRMKLASELIINDVPVANFYLLCPTCVYSTPMKLVITYGNTAYRTVVNGEYQIRRSTAEISIVDPLTRIIFDEEMLYDSDIVSFNFFSNDNSETEDLVQLIKREDFYLDLATVKSTDYVFNYQLRANQKLYALVKKEGSFAIINELYEGKATFRIGRGYTIHHLINPALNDYQLSKEYTHFMDSNKGNNSLTEIFTVEIRANDDATGDFYISTLMNGGGVDRDQENRDFNYVYYINKSHETEIRKPSDFTKSNFTKGLLTVQSWNSEFSSKFQLKDAKNAYDVTRLSAFTKKINKNFDNYTVKAVNMHSMDYAFVKIAQEVSEPSSKIIEEEEEIEIEESNTEVVVRRLIKLDTNILGNNPKIIIEGLSGHFLRYSFSLIPDDQSTEDVYTNFYDNPVNSMEIKTSKLIVYPNIAKKELRGKYFLILSFTYVKTKESEDGYDIYLLLDKGNIFKGGYNATPTISVKVEASDEYVGFTCDEYSHTPERKTNEADISFTYPIRDGDVFAISAIDNNGNDKDNFIEVLISFTDRFGNKVEIGSDLSWHCEGLPAVYGDQKRSKLEGAYPIKPQGKSTGRFTCTYEYRENSNKKKDVHFIMQADDKIEFISIGDSFKYIPENNQENLKVHEFHDMVSIKDGDVIKVTASNIGNSAYGIKLNLSFEDQFGVIEKISSSRNWTCDNKKATEGTSLLRYQPLDSTLGMWGENLTATTCETVYKAPTTKRTSIRFIAQADSNIKYIMIGDSYFQDFSHEKNRVIDYSAPVAIKNGDYLTVQAFNGDADKYGLRLKAIYKDSKGRTTYIKTNKNSWECQQGNQWLKPNDGNNTHETGSLSDTDQIWGKTEWRYTNCRTKIDF